MSVMEFSTTLEAEIAELSEQIELRKKALESAQGIAPEERELFAQTMKEQFYPSAPAATPPPVSLPPVSPLTSLVGTTDYLDQVPPEQAEIINRYISRVPHSGIRRTIKEIQQEHPFIIDAFHDCLVTRLYDELRQRKFVR